MNDGKSTLVKFHLLQLLKWKKITGKDKGGCIFTHIIKISLPSTLSVSQLKLSLVGQTQSPKTLVLFFSSCSSCSSFPALHSLFVSENFILFSLATWGGLKSSGLEAFPVNLDNLGCGTSWFLQVLCCLNSFWSKVPIFRLKLGWVFILKIVGFFSWISWKVNCLWKGLWMPQWKKWKNFIFILRKCPWASVLTLIDDIYLCYSSFDQYYNWFLLLNILMLSLIYLFNHYMQLHNRYVNVLDTECTHILVD